MTTPHTCPVCMGRGTVPNTDALTNTTAEPICPACHGACVLWEPGDAAKAIADAIIGPKNNRITKILDRITVQAALTPRPPLTMDEALPTSKLCDTGGL